MKEAQMEIKPSAVTKKYLVGNIPVSILGLFIGILVAITMNILAGCLLFLMVWGTLYKEVELYFTKTLLFESDKLVLKVACFRFSLNEDSFINIDDMSGGVVYINPKPSLNIYRRSIFWGRLFKNKIKLNVVTRQNFEEMKKTARTISETFGIRFIDDYEFEEPVFGKFWR